MSRVVTIDPRVCVRMPLHLQLFGPITLESGFIDHIRLHGVQTLPEVVPHGDGYMILKGARRCAGAVAAGLDELEVVVKDEVTELREQELEMLCDDDPELRRKQTPELIATMAAEAAKRLGSNREAAKRLGVSRTTVNHAVKAIKARDAYRADGNHEAADQISAALNQGVSTAAGLPAVSSAERRGVADAVPSVQAAISNQTAQRRKILAGTDKPFGVIAKALADAVANEGGLTEESRYVLAAFEELKLVVSQWRVRP